MANQYAMTTYIGNTAQLSAIPVSPGNVRVNTDDGSVKYDTSGVSQIAIAGMSAFQLAQSQGFVGTEAQWIASLKGENGTTPHIGGNGHWWIGLVDTGVNASGEGGSFTGDAFDVRFGDTNVGSVLEDQQAAIDQLLYVPLTASLTGGGTYEFGQTISSVVLNWSYNKPVISQNINNGIGTLAAALRTYTHSGQSITANRTYTLTGNDGTRDATSSTTVSFSHKRYWGVSTNDTLTDTQIRALTSEFSTTRVQTRTFDATGGRYLYIIYPASWGEATFTVGGFAFSGMVLVTRNFVNASGNTTSFNIYRSPLQTGSGIVMGVS